MATPWDARPARPASMGVTEHPQPAAAMADPPSASEVTVAVCTRNRASQLARLLDSLREQHVPPGEILVVDNAPSDETTRDLLQRWPDVRYEREPVAGLDFGRNRALREARGEVVAFVDDDAVADPAWLGHVVQAFRAHPRAGACAGRIEALSLETEAQRLFEANGGFSRGDEGVCLPADRDRPLHGGRAPLVAWCTRIINGCNLAVRRTSCLELGGFDEALDMGAILPGGGDHDMVWRLLQAGHDVLYAPEALVRHEHRREMSGMVDQVLGHQRALIAFLVKAARDARGGQRWSIAMYTGWRVLKPGVRILRRAVGRDVLPLPVLVRLWWHCVLGLTAYPRAQRVARQRQAAVGDAS